MKRKAQQQRKSPLLPSSRPLLLPKSESPEKLAKAKPPAPPGTCCWLRGEQGWEQDWDRAARAVGAPCCRPRWMEKLRAAPGFRIKEASATSSSLKSQRGLQVRCAGELGPAKCGRGGTAGFGCYQTGKVSLETGCSWHAEL